MGLFFFQRAVCLLQDPQIAYSAIATDCKLSFSFGEPSSLFYLYPLRPSAPPSFPHRAPSTIVPNCWNRSNSPRMASSSVLLLPLASLFVITLWASLAASDDPTAYEVLASYGFPDGLLPRTVQNSGEDYVLNEDGSFELHLTSSCRFTIPDSYEVRYSSRISGSISTDKLSSLNGIAVHLFYVWWNIDAIDVNGEDLVFHVGPFSASFASENFSDNPMCTGRDDGHAAQ